MLQDDVAATLSSEGYLTVEHQPSSSWRQLYAGALALFKIQFGSVTASRGFWLQLDARYVLCGMVGNDPLKCAAAMKALCIPPHNDWSVQNSFRDIKNPVRDTRSIPLVLEQICFWDTPRSLRPAASVLCYLGDASVVYLVLQNEFDPVIENQVKSFDGSMMQHTHRYIMDVLGGPEKAFAALLSQLELTDLFKNTRTPFVDRLVHIVKTKNNQKITEIVRATCVLLMHLGGFGDRIISDLLGECDSIIVENAIIKTARAHSMPGAAKRTLFTYLNNNKNPARGRLQAAWILHLMGSSVKAMELHKRGIEGYPLPWNHAVPLPSDVRRRVLDSYRSKLLSGSSLSIMLEANSFELEKYEDYESVDPSKIVFEGLEILGPYAAHELHDSGSGSYHAYKIYTNSESAGVVTGPDCTFSLSSSEPSGVL
jgi:hypothetical protein